MNHTSPHHLLFNFLFQLQQMDEFHKLLGDNNVTLVTSGLITDVEDGLDLVIRRLKVSVRLKISIY